MRHFAAYSIRALNTHTSLVSCLVFVLDCLPFVYDLLPVYRTNSLDYPLKLNLDPEPFCL